MSVARLRHHVDADMAQALVHVQPRQHMGVAGALHADKAAQHRIAEHPGGAGDQQARPLWKRYAVATGGGKGMFDRMGHAVMLAASRASGGAPEGLFDLVATRDISLGPENLTKICQYRHQVVSIVTDRSSIPTN